MGLLDPRTGLFRILYLRKFWFWFCFGGVLCLIRFSKGASFNDAYAMLSRPFWPGPAQREWIQKAMKLENQARIILLEQDNRRLREMLSLEKSLGTGHTSAAVISRTPKGWWQRLELNQGELKGISPGNPVIGPGGLLGIVESVTPSTSKVRLLTSPGSRTGVWTERNKQHGILVGIGTNRRNLLFLDKSPQAMPGDLVSTSPASSLLPPNLLIGVIQSVDNQALPTPKAIIQLSASPDAIDWVQVRLN